MKTYLNYKNQIQGFSDVADTVKIVEKIAASRIHFLKQKTANLNIYAAEIKKVMARLSVFHQKKEHPFLKKRKSGKKALVILAGDKGLVGGLWHGIAAAFLENRKSYQSIIAVGAKAQNYLKEEALPIAKSFAGLSDNPAKEEIEQIANYIFAEFRKGGFWQADILYPRFISLAQQQNEFIQFLPFDFGLSKEKQEAAGLPIFEPSKKAIFDKLLQKYIRVFFHKIMMETKLSELAARTVAMEHASVKTDEFVQKFIFDYKKERLRFMTQKQMESFAAHKII